MYEHVASTYVAARLNQALIEVRSVACQMKSGGKKRHYFFYFNLPFLDVTKQG